jgi:ribosomal protein L19
VFIKLRGSINAKIEIYQGSVLCAESTSKSETILSENATFGYKCPMTIKIVSGQVSKISLFIRTINTTARSVDVVQV